MCSDSDDFVNPVRKKLCLQKINPTKKKCDICGKTFQRPSHVLRHKRNVHNVDILQTTKVLPDGKYECDICTKTFTTARSRWRHRKNIHKDGLKLSTLSSNTTDIDNKLNASNNIDIDHIVNENNMNTTDDANILTNPYDIQESIEFPSTSSTPKKYTCFICEKSFSSLKNSQRHKKNIHGIEKLRFSCEYCHSSFRCRKKLLHHKCESNLIDLNENNDALNKCKMKYSCRICKKSFTNLSSCRKHERYFHAYSTKQKVTCPLCNCGFLSKNILLEHVRKTHGEHSQPEKTLKFQTLTEFYQWKNKIEEETLSQYVLTSKSYVNKTGIVKTYLCHRSGSKRSRCKGVRHVKLTKTDKVGTFCPANIRAVINKITSEVSVKFCATHLGHDFQVKHMTLTKREKDKIAGELHAGVPTSFILNRIAENASPTKRLAATTAQDIRNIARSYGVNVNAIRSEDDVTSVDCWVKEMQSGEYNPILIYKLPGERNTEFPDMEDGDFILGFMNAAQEEILKIYGSEVILVDSTHGTNKYDIQLTSLVIKDDNWEGFPVAFLWSNRQHESLFSYFFQSIRNRVGNIKTNAFMSDDYVAFYNAWCKVFDRANFYVLCDWHIKRAWKKHLTSGSTQVKDQTKLQDTLNMLCEMINEVDINTFEKLFQNAKTKLLTDKDTFLFACYFIANYGNRVKQWAACYRVGSKINTNMTVERWHKDLKYNSDLKGKCGGRLDKAIHSLMGSLRLKFLNRLSSLQRGKVTKKLILLRKTHKVAENIKDDIEIYNGTENEWIVTSASQEGQTYKVTALDLPPDHYCNLKCEICNTCIHKMKCECPNNAIKYNMCKHIHAVCLKKQGYHYSDIGTESQPEPEYIGREKKAIAVTKIDSKTLSELKEEARSATMSLLTEIQTFENEEQYKELIKCISIVKHKCRALKSSKTLPPVSTKTSSLKKIQPQRCFPQKKKKSKKVSLQPNFKSKDTIKKIIPLNPENYARPQEMLVLDHNYYNVQENSDNPAIHNLDNNS